MTNNRTNQVIAIVALMIAVLGLSVGFAAFSRTLTIESGASVKPSEDSFQVRFSSSDESYAKNEIVPTKVTNGSTFTATNAVISDSDELKLEGLSATFTEPSQSVTYTLYIENAGKYKAFLNSITFGTVSGNNSFKVCTPVGDADPAKVAAACNGITYTVKTAGQTFTTTNNDITDANGVDPEKFSVVEIEIAYANNATLADGDFTVQFGSVTLDYSTIK